MLNTRETAFLIWLVVIVIAAFAWKPTRPHAFQIARTAFTGSVLVAGLLIVGWVLALTYAFYRLGIWTTDLWADTVSIATFTALSAVLNKRILNGQGTPRSLAAQLLTPVIVLEILTNLGTFDLWVELLIPLVILLFSLIGLFPPLAAKVTSSLLVLVSGLLVLVYSIVTFIRDAEPDDYTTAAQQLVYTALVLALLIPFALLFGSLTVYSDAFRRSTFQSNKAEVPAWRGKAALLAVFRANTALLGRMPFNFAMKVGRQTTMRLAVEEARRGRAAFLGEEQAKLDRQNQLIEFANVSGTDVEGRQLDQREHEETRNALVLLPTFMLVRHQQTGEFQESVLSDAVGTYSFEKLKPPNIEIRISSNRQAWFAWRRTIGGWVFAVGQSNPKDDWRFDGPEPPQSYPRIGDEWGEIGGSKTANW